MRYPETLKQLTKEIRESAESEAGITVTSTMRLPCLTAPIKKTLRIHHPTPINLRRVVPPEGQMAVGFLEGSSHPFPYFEFLAAFTEDNHADLRSEHHRREIAKFRNDPDNCEEPRVFHPERLLPETDSRYN